MHVVRSLPILISLEPKSPSGPPVCTLVHCSAFNPSFACQSLNIAHEGERGEGQVRQRKPQYLSRSFCFFPLPSFLSFLFLHFSSSSFFLSFLFSFYLDALDVGPDTVGGHAELVVRDAAKLDGLAGREGLNTAQQNQESKDKALLRLDVSAASSSLLFIFIFSSFHLPVAVAAGAGVQAGPVHQVGCALVGPEKQNFWATVPVEHLCYFKRRMGGGCQNLSPTIEMNTNAMMVTRRRHAVRYLRVGQQKIHERVDKLLKGHAGLVLVRAVEQNYALGPALRDVLVLALLRAGQVVRLLTPQSKDQEK